jgi:hypothetical protein
MQPTPATSVVCALAGNGEVTTTTGAATAGLNFHRLRAHRPKNVVGGQHEPLGTSDGNATPKGRRRRCLGVAAEIEDNRLGKTKPFCMPFVPLMGGPGEAKGGQGRTRALSTTTHQRLKFDRQMGRSARVGLFGSHHWSVSNQSADPRGPFHTA